MDFYPINLFPYILTIVGVMAATALALWVASKDGSARAIGMAALMPIVFVTGWTWLPSLPEWTAWLTAAVVALLFVIGMTRDETHDDIWHYSAWVVAVFGKLLFEVVPLLAALLLALLLGEVTIPIVVLLAPVVVTVVAVIGWRSERLRRTLRLLNLAD